MPLCRAWIGLAALILGIATAGCTPITDQPTTDPTTTSQPAPDPASTTMAPADATALEALQDLVIKGRAPMTGYERDDFGYREEDTDGNGCDVRNDVLRRDLDDLTIKQGTNGCVVESGTLEGPYSGNSISFRRGAETSADVQIDHVVALGNAWVTGAFQWDQETMREFGNDPMNLLAVDGPLNSQKGDGDAATWLPPNRAFRCEYVAAQIAVKTEYDLWVTPPEHDTMTRVLSTCPAQQLPAWPSVPLAPGREGPPPTSGPDETTESAPENTDNDNGQLDPPFASCADAIDGGYGPYLAERDPEYYWYRDADGDGAVCER